MAWNVGDSRSITHTFVKDEVARFASLTGDDNPLHVDETYARRTSAGGRVVHGMLAASYISTLIGTQIPGPGSLWMSFNVQWRKPIRLGDTLRFDAVIARVHESTGVLDLQITGIDPVGGEVYLSATAAVTTVEEDAPPPTESEVAAPAGRLLTGHRIVITGASGEVGAAIARRLAAEGARPVLWGRDPERLQALGIEIATMEGGCESDVVDLTSPPALERALARVAAHGPVHGIVHAAAPQMSTRKIDDPAFAHDLSAQIQVNTVAFHQIVTALAPTMPAGASVVALLTQAVIGMPPKQFGPYVSGKMALWGLVRAMAVEYGPRGIRFNGVSPGLMNTPFSRDIPSRTKQIEAASNPLRRLCRVDDVAEAVCFLCEPRSAFLNGVNLPLTGGAATL